MMTAEEQRKEEELRKQALMKEDREDLVGLLEMMYGPLPVDVAEKIEALDDMDQVSRLILVAANSRSLKEVVDEIDLGTVQFRILSPAFEQRNA